MKSLRIITLLAGLMLAFAISAAAQVTVTNSGNTTPGLAATYTDLASAITALNGQTAISGPVTITLNASNPQTAPSGGYSITAILAGASAVNTVTIEGSGNTITAANPAGAVGALNDGFFRFIGSDFMILQNFVMNENPLNTTTAAATNNMMEWGVALLYATTTNGAQNITVQNNTITLNRTYQNTFGIYSNSTHTATAVTTSATATTTAGGNSGLRIYGNTISNVNQGISVVGPTAAADNNTGVDIGGTGGVQANTITNWGTTGTFSAYANVSGTVNGILVRNSTGFNISFNTLTSSVGGTTSGTLNGIQIPAFSNAPTGTFTNNINNNTLSVQSGLIAGAINGINIPGTSATVTSTLNINNNNFTALNHTVSGTAAIQAIINVGSSTAGPLTHSISSNTFTNISANTTGSFTFISNSWARPTNGVGNINNNSIVTAFNKTGAGGTITLYTSNSTSGATVNETNNNNNFSNMTVTGATTIAGWRSTDGGSPIKTVTGNTFANWTAGTSAVTGLAVSFSSVGTVTNNAINTISCACTLIGLESSSGTQTLSQNTIHTLSGTGTGTVTGISNSGGTTQIYSRNRVYNIENTNTLPVAAGITVSSGTTVTLQNNLVGDIRTPNSGSTNSLNGINISGGTTVNAYFNTVYLNATSTGANFGSSAINVSTTPTTTLRNNIFVNNSTAVGTGLSVAHRRSSATLSTYAAASNNNDFFASTIYTDGTTPQTTITAYKALVASRDSASFAENPPFVSTTGSSPNFLHISLVTPTQLESGGTTVSGITDDFDGDTRNVTTPDIGADEFAGTPLDLSAPSITYSPLLNTSSTGDRTLTVTITDPSGIAGGALAPRIYYRKNAGTYFSSQCTGSSPTYTCTIVVADVGGVTATDVIQYFVVAQDTAGNVGANPSGGFAATNVNNVTSPPTTPNQYAIVAAISGTFNVGAGQTYTSLTNTGGIFEFINNSEVAGDITINITSDLSAASGTLVAETGTVALNQFASPFTVLIKPSGGTRLVNGPAASTALIRFNGASRVTIDGSLAGGTDRSLTIENTSVTAPQVVRFGSIGAAAITSDTLRNTTIINGVNTSSAVVVSDNAGTAGTFNNITIRNNDIQRAFIGIFTNATVLAGNGSGLMITQNKLDNTAAIAIRNTGIYVQGADGATVSNNMVGNFNGADAENDTGIWLATGAVNTAVSNNTVTNIAYTGTSGNAPIGIRDSGGAASASGNSITGNTVSNITTTGGTQVFGIEDSSGGTLINRNNVQGVINSNTGTFGAYGINISAGNNVVVRNNFISNVTGDMTGGAAFSTSFGIFGLRVAAGTGHQIYNNSVNLYGLRTGTATTSLLTAAFAIVGTTSTGMDVRNNLFANNITGGTTSIANVSVYLPPGGTSAMNLSWNNNAYFFGTDVARSGAGQAGTTAGTNFFTTFDPTMTTPASNLRSYTNTLMPVTGNDIASLGFTTAPPLVSNNDLHLTVPNTLLGAGAAIGSVTVDYDLDPRPASNPDIGADEVVQSVAGSFPTGTFYNAILAGGDTLAGNVTITNSLTLTGISNTGANTLTLGCNATVSGSGMNNYVIGTVAKQFCMPGSFTYPVGTAPDNMFAAGIATPEYSPFTANVTAVGTIPSTLTVRAIDGVLAGSNPMQSASRYWDVTETGDITADISYTYLDQDVLGNEAMFNVLRRESGTTAVVAGGTVNAVTNTASVSGVTNFSQWGAGLLAPPTAATVSISGRLTTANGAGIRNATVMLTGGNLTEPRYARTGSFGTYSFDDLAVGQTYVLSVISKRYTFANTSIVVNLSEDVSDADFHADPQ